MKIKPLHDKVLIKRSGEEDKTKGGIIIPDTAKEKPSKGKVVAVGGGALNNEGKVIPMIIKTGDTVLFAKWGGTEIKIEGKEYIIMKESDVLAIEI